MPTSPSFSAFTKYYERVNGIRIPEAEHRQQRSSTPAGGVGKQRDFPGGALFTPLLNGARKYTDISVPALVLFANPHGLGPWVEGNTDLSVRTAARSYSSSLAALTERQRKAVETGVPTAHVITLPGAHHHMFLSNEADVIREMRKFVNSLP
jgi:hypothetical protein